MKKIVISKPGNYEALELKEFENPKPDKGQVLIEVKAIGVNFADCLIRMGVYQSAKDFVGWPITPGFEVSGIIKEVGEGVTQFVVGQKVIATTLFGGYTTHLVVSEDQIFSLPDALTYEQGAAIPVIFLTAYYALFELAHPRKGDKLLIHSAAGGVGSALIQMGKVAECKMFAVVGAQHKVPTVIGADVVIDKSTQNLWEEAKKFAPEGFDVILDANGTETLKADYKHLASGGKLVIYGFHSLFEKGKGTPNWFKLLYNYLTIPKFNPMSLTNQNKSVMGFNLSYMFKKKNILQEPVYKLLEWFRAGKLQPPPIKTYKLEDAALAQKDLESGQTVGKLILIND